MKVLRHALQVSTRCEQANDGALPTQHSAFRVTQAYTSTSAHSESLFADGKLLTTQIKRLASADMNIDRLAQSWNATATREWSIDARRDRVCEAVSGKYVTNQTATYSIV